jgi:hypothetical protein
MSLGGGKYPFYPHRNYSEFFYCKKNACHGTEIDFLYTLLQNPALYEFSKVCITFDEGLYTIYYNGQFVKEVPEDPMPINSQDYATLGWAEGKSPFKGYIDDVSIRS